MPKYSFNFAQDDKDLRDAQALRSNIFRSGHDDRDGFDARAQHGLVRDSSGMLVCTFRMTRLDSDALDESYSAQFYNLDAIKSKSKRALEIGRFCVHPDHKDQDIIRLAWGEIARFVTQNDIDLLFGCSSFKGVDDVNYEDAFLLLKERYLAPQSVMPKVKASKISTFAKILGDQPANLQKAMSAMPPCLRSYLAMGGWVSDHAVRDDDLGTLHVFTGVQVSNIPSNRLRAFLSLMERC